jgi:hypothetical protein
MISNHQCLIIYRHNEEWAKICATAAELGQLEKIKENLRNAYKAVANSAIPNTDSVMINNFTTNNED